MRNVLVKVGGSLLTLPDLQDRLRSLFRTLSCEQVTIVVGGGAATDVVRNWEVIHRLDHEVAHWLAIESMSLTAGLVVQLLSETTLIHDRHSARSCHRSGNIAVLEPRSILDELHRETGQQLPVGWHCTSDSIAGWIATGWKADAIVLAKSVDAPNPEDSSIPGQCGTVMDAVDECFESIVADRLPVYWCNVRTSPESITLWKAASTGTGKS
ncbi:MAG: hypothetical protein O3B13_11725 [Planctomycetota bacterium]|nr:hypothetical protein [Planctomycetota bacterium]